LDITNNPNEIAIIVALAYLLAGLVKGVIGIGLPTTAITIMTFFISPLIALGLNLIPMTVANIWQFSKADNPKEVIVKYKYFAISLVVCILITSFYAEKIGDDLVRLIFAFAVLSSSLSSLFSFEDSSTSKGISCCCVTSWEIADLNLLKTKIHLSNFPSKYKSW